MPPTTEAYLNYILHSYEYMFLESYISVKWKLLDQAQKGEL